MPSTLAIKSVSLTPKAEQGKTQVKLKVFWKTSRFWTQSDVIDFQKSVPAISERLRREQYWTSEGAVQQSRFTCEDFAVRILIDYASAHGLPVKLATGVRTYRNMEIYKPREHDQYPSNPFGFGQLVMLTYGAPDMQRTEVNTQKVSSAELLLPGDILALALDRPGSTTAHHIQVVMDTTQSSIDVNQGNSAGAIVRPFSTIMRVIGRNMADPRNQGYAGMKPEVGHYQRSVQGWDYQNLTTGSSQKDFLKKFLFYRWNFMEFNR